MRDGWCQVTKPSRSARPAARQSGSSSGEVAAFGATAGKYAALLAGEEVLVCQGVMETSELIVITLPVFED